MNALQFHQHGDPSVLVYEQVDVPIPGPGEVLLAVRACAINGLDVFARRGTTETGVPLPMITGADIAGDVVGVGDRVDCELGRRVVVNPRLFCGRCNWCLRGEQSACINYQVIGWHRPGGFAEYVTVPYANCIEIPKTLDYVQAAALPVTFTTAWRMLVTKAKLLPAETVLVLGASGGVAVAAVQIAQLMGARVAAITTGDRKVEAIVDLGAELVIDHQQGDISGQIQNWTAGRGVDVIVQTQGGPTWHESLQQVAPMGRIVVCAALQGNDPAEDLGAIIWKQITVMGSTGATPLDFASVVELAGLLKLKPVVDAVFPLSDGREALSAFERHDHVGKVVLQPGPGFVG